MVRGPLADFFLTLISRAFQSLNMPREDEKHSPFTTTFFCYKKFRSVSFCFSQGVRFETMSDFMNVSENSLAESREIICFLALLIIVIITFVFMILSDSRYWRTIEFDLMKIFVCPTT